MSLLSALKTPNRLDGAAAPAKRAPPKPPPTVQPPAKRPHVFRFSMDGEAVVPGLRTAALRRQGQSPFDEASSSTNVGPEAPAVDGEEAEEEIEEHRIVLMHPSLSDVWTQSVWKGKPPEKGDWKCFCGMWNFKVRQQCNGCGKRRSRGTEKQVQGMLPRWLRLFFGENLAGWPRDIPNYIPTASVCLKDEAALTQCLTSEPPVWRGTPLVWWAEKSQRFQDSCTVSIGDCPTQCSLQSIADYYTERLPGVVIHHLEKFSSSTFCSFDVEFSSAELRARALELPPPCGSAALHPRDRDRELLLQPCPPFCTDTHIRGHFQKLGPDAIVSVLPRGPEARLVTFRMQAQMQQALAFGHLSRVGPIVCDPIQLHRLLTFAQEKARRLQCVGLPADATEETVRHLFDLLPPYCIESIAIKGDHAVVTFLDHEFARRALRATEGRLPGTIGISYCEKYEWNLQTLAMFRLPPGIAHSDIRRFYKETLGAIVHVEYVIYKKVRHLHFSTVEAANAALRLKLPPNVFGSYSSVEESIRRRQMLEILEGDPPPPLPPGAAAAEMAMGIPPPPPAAAEAEKAVGLPAGAAAEKEGYDQGEEDEGEGEPSGVQDVRPSAAVPPPPKESESGPKDHPFGKQGSLQLDLHRLPDTAAQWKTYRKYGKAQKKKQRKLPTTATEPQTSTCEIITSGSGPSVRFHPANRSGVDRVAAVLDIQWALRDGQWEGRGRVQWVSRANEDFARVHKDLLKIEATTQDTALTKGNDSDGGSDAESSDSRLSY
eukprot:EG_transcript_3385